MISMKVKVITDSTSDITAELTKAFGITVIPVYVRFGDKVYKDGVDIRSDDFFQKLISSTTHPSTSQPTPDDFAKAYSECSKEATGIISIHISSKISGTYNSALVAKEMLGDICPIEIVDSKFNSAGLALVVIAAARLAQQGHNMEDTLEEAHRAIKQVRMFGVFDTMKYMARSGRVSRAVAAAANILDVKPLLTFRDGEIVRAGLVRTALRGMDKLYQFVKNRENIQELAIVHSVVPEQANELKRRLGNLFPEDKILILQLGAALGAHGGPGVLLIALRESD